MTRITQQSQALAMRADLSSVGSRLATIQRQVASGRQIERISDAPSVGLEALRYRRSLRSYEQYDRNLSDAKNWLGAADTALEAVDSRINRAQDLAIQADNGSLSPAARVAIATELRSIADEMVGVANTHHLGRPIFAGTSGAQQAYDSNGSFLGDTNVVNRTVASGATTQVNAVGPDVFGVENPGDPANGNTIEMIRAMADDVEAGTIVAGSLDSLDAARSRVHTAQATLGARLASLEQLEVRNDSVTHQLRTGLSEAEDVDLTKAILDLKGQETAYTAALSISGRILSQSLLDFLR